MLHGKRLPQMWLSQNSKKYPNLPEISMSTTSQKQKMGFGSDDFLFSKFFELSVMFYLLILYVHLYIKECQWKLG